MRAALFDPEGGFRLGEVPEPEPDEGEIVVEVAGCGVCGSDRQIAAGATAPAGTVFPAVFGHEISGYVDGRPVAVFPIVPCGSCRLCSSGQESLCLAQQVIGYHRPGGYAERVAVPEDRVIPLPQDVPLLVAGLLMDAVATPFHALRSVVHLEAGESVAVVGGGGLGLGALLGARAMGAGATALVTRREPDGVLRGLAERLGAQELWSTAEGTERSLVREVRRWSGGGVDVVLDTAGSVRSVGLAMGLLRPGGRLCVVGMEDEGGGPLPPISHWVRRGIVVAGSYAATVEDARTLVGWAGSGRIEPALLEAMVAEVRPLAEIEEVFRQPGRTGRVVIRPEV
ncbi:alcohol dehydrogenase catalytic domain-containing protein [Rubrobacter calidifluminis]|uniref:alcohol dehydrogenase catalytic domain-containing protein n=1 Tax=Rubrobacter calidifluminis TaxID=1392640 RepID=UPI002360951A|nr:alcohol dehydrogenase catalytic domain-containing protein [Rubrobacter calidifluminis]